MIRAFCFGMSACVLALAVAATGCGAPAENVLVVRGSDTMVHLVSSWAEDFMAAHPDYEVSTTGGGSGTGIAALFNQTTDICASSRSLKEEEWDQAEELGIEPHEVEVALDGIAIVVNSENPVEELTLEQIRRIYTGEYTNWNEVGGNDQEIVPASRENNSGTYVYFQEHVLNEQNYATRVMPLPANSSIVQEVSKNAEAIGYVGLGYAEDQPDLKITAVKEDEDSPAFTPETDTIYSGEYPIARPLHFYTNGEPPPAIQTFIDFCLSEQGDEIVIETGYVPMPE
ncbi:MAG: PstS family phosphate ABC transporter substrate-binding protein [Candidatus Hydrogenedentota bacterium]